jgi:hypothetical protein
VPEAFQVYGALRSARSRFGGRKPPLRKQEQ